MPVGAFAVGRARRNYVQVTPSVAMAPLIRLEVTLTVNARSVEVTCPFRVDRRQPGEWPTTADALRYSLSRFFDHPPYTPPPNKTATPITENSP
jgi:hypothetical protein